MTLFGTLVWIVSLLCFIWVVYDILAVQDRMKTAHKVLWIIAAVLFSIITAIVYYFVVKRK